MKKKNNSLVYISIIIVVILGLYIYFTYNNAINSLLPNITSQQNISPSPILGTAVLTLQKHPHENKVDVVIESGKKPISAVQVVIAYDAKVVSNVSVTNGDFFDTPIVLTNKVTSDSGNIFYAVAVAGTEKTKIGKGVIATMSYIPTGSTGTQTTLKFLPKTKVTTVGLDQSTLKTSTGLTLSL